MPLWWYMALVLAILCCVINPYCKRLWTKLPQATLGLLVYHKQQSRTTAKPRLSRHNKKFSAKVTDRYFRLAHAHNEHWDDSGKSFVMTVFFSSFPTVMKTLLVRDFIPGSVWILWRSSEEKEKAWRDRLTKSGRHPWSHAGWLYCDLVVKSNSHSHLSLQNVEKTQIVTNTCDKK